MNKCPHCDGDHTLSQCPTWKVLAAEQALTAAALNLAGETKTSAALLPIPDTTPALFVGFGEAADLARLVGYNLPPAPNGYRLVPEQITPAVEEALRRHTPMPQTAWAECMAAVERVEYLAAQAPIQSGADSKPDLSDLARLFADAFESRKALTLSPDSCGQLFYAMTTPPAAQQQASTAQEQSAIVPTGWRDVIEKARDSICAGGTAEHAQYERSIVGPHLDGVYDELDALEKEVAQAHALTDAARDVLTERQRQVSAEGWTPEHDDEHSGGDLAVAAACYAVENSQRLASKPPQSWPWGAIWWKPKGNRQNLVRAGALILAEIERLDRAANLTRKGA